MVEYHLLGPLEVWREGELVHLPTGAVRTVLAVLLLDRGDVVSAGRLAEELWDGTQPASAHKIIHVRISQLRRALGEDAIETLGRGYRLAAADGAVDADRFDALIDGGRGAATAGRSEEALALYDEALGLWRGDALADVELSLEARAGARRLDERRLQAVEERGELMLASGRGAEILGDLEALVASHPLRETPWAQLMLARYRLGRHAEALAAFDSARHAFDEVGLQPSERLRRLQVAILRQDPELDVPRPAAPSRETAHHERRRSRWLAAAAIAAVVAIVGGLAFGRLSDEAKPEPKALLSVPPNSVGVVDPSRNALVAAVPVGIRPTAVAADGASVWVVNEGDRTIMKIDGRQRTVVGTRGLAVSRAADVDAAGGLVWVAAVRSARASYGGERQAALLVRIDAATQTVQETKQVGAPSLGTAVLAPSVAAEAGAVWLAHVGTLFRLSEDTAGVDARTEVVSAVDVAAGEGAVWVVSRSGGGVEFEPTGVLQRVDPVYSTVVETIPLGGMPTSVALGKGSVWVTRATDDALVRIDPATNSTMTTISVGRRPVDVAVGHGSVWVANAGDATISRIDPASNTVVATIPLGSRPDAIAAGEGLVWVTVY